MHAQLSQTSIWLCSSLNKIKNHCFDMLNLGKHDGWNLHSLVTPEKPFYHYSSASSLLIKNASSSDEESDDSEQKDW